MKSGLINDLNRWNMSDLNKKETDKQVKKKKKKHTHKQKTHNSAITKNLQGTFQKRPLVSVELSNTLRPLAH